MHQNCPIYVPILLALAVFGVIYNRWVEKLEREGSDRGYMGFIVALGCAVTLAGAALIVGLEPVFWTLVCFAASGTPMILGSISRHCRARKQKRQECLDHDADRMRGEHGE